MNPSVEKRRSSQSMQENLTRLRKNAILTCREPRVALGLVPARHAVMIETVSKLPMPESHQPAFEIHSGITLKGQLSMAKDIVLTGKFEGDLQTLGSLTVAAGGVMIGSIDAGGLILKPGNLVEARVKVGVTPKPVAEKEKPAASGWKRGFQKLKQLAMGRA
jgi:hypothetical protein